MYLVCYNGIRIFVNKVNLLTHATALILAKQRFSPKMSRNICLKLIRLCTEPLEQLRMSYTIQKIAGRPIVCQHS